jgi:anti-sigma regulatory factor (Ser/Thr protein kinase)
MKKDFETVKEYVIKRSDEIEPVETDILKQVAIFFREEMSLRILLEETISNAVYHAPTTKDGKEKYIKHSQVVLDPGEYVDIVLAKDEEKYAISVTDKSGRLTKETVLYKLDRNIHAENLLDENGRGIHMSRMYTDRFVINIKPLVKTEIIMMNYFTQKYKGYKPLYINEL